MTIDERSKIMRLIISWLKNKAFLENKPFDGARLFFDLAGMDEKDLLKVKRLCGV